MRQIAPGQQQGRLDMNDRPEILPFKIEQWDETGTQVENLIARAGHHSVAFSAFEAASRLYPSRIVTLRRGTMVIQINRDH
jgi:hypothetical protein